MLKVVVGCYSSEEEIMLYVCAIVFSISTQVELRCKCVCKYALSNYHHESVMQYRLEQEECIKGESLASERGK